MDESAAIVAFGALAQETRLRVFRVLIAAHPEGIPAGQVAASVGVPHNTMSTHLATLTRAGLTRSQKRGRTIFYQADLEGFRALVGFLTSDCCGGRPDICAPILMPVLSACDCTPEEVSP
ncbi:MAG: helix-turn-helix transcriptional regulator [Bauldia sp.]|nr:helix-turn-helix transcriptional regulator [Bauldia sp.]